MEDDYPHILFAKDAELYELNGLFTFVVGGAYSVDKNYRLLHGMAWWPDEQPSDEIKHQVEEKLEGMDWEVDVVLTHTAPLKYEPTEVFLPMINQSTVDKSTEQWLDSIEEHYIMTGGIAGITTLLRKSKKFNLCTTILTNFLKIKMAKSMMKMNCAMNAVYTMITHI